MENIIGKLVEEIKEHFKSKGKYFKIFSEQRTRIEDWFRGELLFIFDKLKQEIDKFKCEYSECFDGDDRWKSVDLFFEQNKTKEKYLIELKALLIGKDRKDNKRTLGFYKTGISNDLIKLEKLKDYKRYMLAFVYPGCTEEDIKKDIEKIIKNLKSKLKPYLKDKEKFYLYEEIGNISEETEKASLLVLEIK
ncbi:MAG: hypothetical protein FWC57_04365 [Endomicrobia bacterium]|nr:hypothetical protein [Endomicrobiia bacterium]